MEQISRREDYQRVEMRTKSSDFDILDLDILTFMRGNISPVSSVSRYHESIRLLKLTMTTNAPLFGIQVVLLQPNMQS